VAKGKGSKGAAGQARPAYPAVRSGVTGAICWFFKSFLKKLRTTCEQLSQRLN
jgi:hypothetical protein